MIELPTVAQINAITDVPALRALCDEVERTVIQIETQLEHDVGDDDWAKRAANALALFRYTERVLKRRIYKLKNRAAEHRPAVRRPEEDTHPLTLRALTSVQGGICGLAGPVIHSGRANPVPPCPPPPPQTGRGV